MSLAIGSVSLVSAGSTSTVTSTPASTGGSGSITTVMYRSTVSGFTPGSGANAIGTASAATQVAQTFTDTGLVPGVTYYYTAIATDSSGTPQTASAAQLTVTTSLATPQPNQFAMAPYLGMLDQRYNGNTVAVTFDPTSSGSLIAGQAVVWSTTGSNTLGGIDPYVKASTAGTDLVAGFVNYNIKNAQFNPGDRLEISLYGNVMYLTALAAINRGGQVNSVPSGVAGGAIGGVTAAVSGSPWCGFSLDQASAGTLTRIFIQTPANTALHS